MPICVAALVVPLECRLIVQRRPASVLRSNHPTSVERFPGKPPIAINSWDRDGNAITFAENLPGTGATVADPVGVPTDGWRVRPAVADREGGFGVFGARATVADERKRGGLPSFRGGAALQLSEQASAHSTESAAIERGPIMCLPRG